MNDSAKLQAAMDCLANWAGKWELDTALNKADIMQIGDKHSRFTYTLNRFSYTQVSLIKDLGVA